MIGIGIHLFYSNLFIYIYNRGKISYHTEPPEDTDAHISSRLVSSDAVKEFDLEAYDKENMVFPETMDTAEDKETTSVEGDYIVTAKKGKKKKGAVGLSKQKGQSLMDAESGLKTKKINKLIEKKRRKSQKKSGTVNFVNQGAS